MSEMAKPILHYNLFQIMGRINRIHFSSLLNNELVAQLEIRSKVQIKTEELMKYLVIFQS